MFGRRPVALRFGEGRQRPPTTLDEVMTSVSWLWINVIIPRTSGYVKLSLEVETTINFAGLK